MRLLIKKVNIQPNKKPKTKQIITHYLLPTLLILTLIITTALIIQTNNNVNALTRTDQYDTTYYVSANGNDTTNDGLSTDTPFATLAKTAEIINGKEIDGNYLVIVMTDLTSTACARYYDHSVTITSISDTPPTVTRGTNFTVIADNARSWYNPPMLEIQSTNLTTTAPKITLTLKNIIFDDAYLHEGTTFSYAPTPHGNESSTAYVQDAIVSSYALSATIILDTGAELHNFGGMTAIRAGYQATVVLNSDSLITDIRPNANTNNREVNTATNNWAANGEAAISIADSYLYMHSGSKITNIANTHAIKFTGTIACFMDGEISNMIGNKGMDTDPNGNGRGVKSAIYFDRSATVDHTNTAAHISGSAIIGPNATIHSNAIKCGAICVSRNPNTSVKIHGKINNNTGGTGSLGLGANGGGLYIVSGGTIYLEDGCEITGNSIRGGAYGGAASVQQSGSKLVMNGGTISGNSGSVANPGITVNKGDASFEMNGGIIENGDQALHLYESGSDGTVGKLTLNAGTVSGVTVDPNILFGYHIQRYLFINQDNVTIETGYARVAGRNVYPISADFKIGNPNTATYTNIQSNLPKDWTMPTNNGNVIGFWLQKNGSAKYSIPKPTTGTGGINYNASLNSYFVAIQATTADGIADTNIPLKLYPTSIIRVGNADHIVVSVPLDAYPNGATVALVQPTTVYGEIIITGPPTLYYDLTANDYTINYTTSYNMPQGLHAALIADGHNNENTQFQLILYPDSRTTPDLSNLVLTSDIFEIKDIPVWNTATREVVLTLKLKDDWNTTTDLELNFEFNCNMVATEFEEGEFLRLTGNLIINGKGQTYEVPSNEAKTEMKIQKGNLDIKKILSGNRAEDTETFHFTITFSDGGTYDGIVNGTTIPLKGGENKLIEGIIQGINYTVIEQEANQDGYTTTSTGASGTISENLSEAIFINSRGLPEYVVTINDSFAGELSGAGKYIESTNVTIRAGNCKGYDFSGWTVDDVTVGLENNTSATTSFIMPANNVTLTANWTPIAYNIVYVLSSGTNAPSNPSMYTALDLPLSIAAPSRTNFLFVGWIAIYSDGTPALTTSTVSYSIPQNTTGRVILYAQWQQTGGVSRYTVTYNGNGNTGGVVPIDTNSPYIRGSTVVVLSQGSLIRENYTFLGWATNPTADIPTYTVDSEFTIQTDTVLYAVWTQTKYTVTYKPGEHGTFDEQVTTDLSFGIPTPKSPEVTGEIGWIFTGWNPIPSETVTENAIYTAQWKQEPNPELFTVQFVDWDGRLLKSEQVPYGGNATAPANPSRVGYTFTGWSPSTFTNITSDLTVIARYSQNGGGSSGGGGSSNKPTPSPSPSPSPSPLPSLSPSPSPSAPPIGGGTDENELPAWALVNLILSIVGLVLAILLVVWVLLSRKQKQTKQPQEKQTPANQDKYGANQREAKEEVRKQKRYRTLWFVLGGIMGIGGFIVFLLTEDTSRPMILVDKWTIVNVIMFAVQLIAITFTFKPKNKKNKEDAKQEVHSASSPR